MSASGVDCRGRTGCTVAALLMIVSLAIAPEGIAGTARFNQPRGEIRGTSPAQVSFDGKGWIALGSGTLPVFDKTLIRARSGTVAVSLSDGSRLEASPTTELAITVMGSSTFVRVVEGNVLFRLPPSATARLVMPGGTIQTAAIATSSSGRAAATRISTGAQTQRDTLGVIIAQKGGTPRVRLLSGEALLISQNGSVTERLKAGQVRTLMAQSTGASPFKLYAAAAGESSALLPPTDPPSELPKPEHVWTWSASNPQGVHGGWAETQLGVPPVTPPPPEQELRRGFAWAYKDQWLIAKRECGQFAAFRRPPTGATATLPPPVDPPSQAAKPEHVWAWHPSNPPQVFGGWQEVQLGSPPGTPPRPDQELYDGFTWAWEEKPEQRWVVVEECGMAAAFLGPASGLGGLALLGGAGTAVGVPIGLSSGGGATPIASNATP